MRAELWRMVCAMLSYETYRVLLTRGNDGGLTPWRVAKPLKCWCHVEWMFLLHIPHSSVTPFMVLLLVRW
jgi:hypothetical protein